MTIIGVTPADDAVPVGVSGYALDNFGNVTDQTIITRLEALGFFPGGSGRPVLLAALTASGVARANWPTTNMYSVVAACAAAAIATGTVADIGGINGSIRCDGPTIVFTPGSGFSHNPTSTDTRLSGSSGKIGTTFLRYNSAYNLSPVFAMQSNTVLHCNGLYPDLMNEGLGLDPTNYPTITGSLTEYAPFVCADHSAPANIDYLDVQINVPLAYKIAYFGDGDASVDTWAAPFLSGQGKTFGGLRGWVRGMALVNDLQLNRVAVSSDITGFHFDTGPQNCIESLSQRSNAQMLRDPTMTEAADTPLVAYRQKNCINIKGVHRWIAMNICGKARIANTVFELSAGTAPASWSAHTTNPSDPNYNASYPAAHPDNGKFVSCNIYGPGGGFIVEGVPTFLRVMENAFCQDLNIKCGRLFKDTISATKQAVFDIRSDGTAGGILSRQGAWASVQNFSIGNKIEIMSSFSDGPIFKNTTAESARDWTFTSGSMIANWNLGNDTSQAWSEYAIVNLASTNNVIVSTDAMTIYRGSFGSSKVFYTDDMNSINACNSNRHMGYAGPDDSPTANQAPYTDICNLQPFPAGGTYHPFGAPDTDDGGGDG